MDRFPIVDAPSVFEEMLRRGGVDPSGSLTLGASWPVFQDFMSIKFDTSDDGILFQSGTYDFDGPTEYHVELDRQFEVLERDGEHDHYEQLRCAFRYSATVETQAWGRFERWWFKGIGPGSWEEFVEAVEKRPEYQALAAQTPAAVEIRFERV